MLVNVLIILIIALFTVIGFKKGVLTQAVMFISTIVIYILAFYLKNPVANFFFEYFPFFNFWGDLEGLLVLNVILYQLIAFVIVAGILFGIFGFIFKATGILQKAVDLTLVLTLPSKITGGIIGFFEGYIIVFLALTVFAVFLEPLGISESVLAHNIMYNSPILSKSLGGINEAIEDIFTLVEDGKHLDVSKNKLNLDAMDAMMKYDVIDEKGIDILLDSKKLNSVSGLSDVILKYRGDE